MRQLRYDKQAINSLMFVFASQTGFYTIPPFFYIFWRELALIVSDKRRFSAIIAWLGYINLFLFKGVFIYILITYKQIKFFQNNWHGLCVII